MKWLAEIYRLCKQSKFFSSFPGFEESIFSFFLNPERLQINWSHIILLIWIDEITHWFHSIIFHPLFTRTAVMEWPHKAMISHLIWWVFLLSGVESMSGFWENRDLFNSINVKDLLQKLSQISNSSEVSVILRQIQQWYHIESRRWRVWKILSTNWSKRGKPQWIWKQFIHKILKKGFGTLGMDGVCSAWSEGAFWQLYQS